MRDMTGFPGYRVLCLTGWMVLTFLVFQTSAVADKAWQHPKTPGKGRTVIGGIPWTPATGKVVYGSDDRIDVYAETDAKRLAWAAATCALVSAGQMTDNGDGTFTLNVSEYTVSGRPACAEEPFGDQPTAPFCTGFVVGDALIATAGHCYDQGDLSSVRFLFGFQMANASDPVTTFDDTQVYSGVEVVGHQLQGDFDYTVIRVDRPITAAGARPLELRRSGVIPVGTKVGVIGHPSGLPMKIAFGDATVVRDNTNEGFFLANLDTYGGNSGSPVFNAETGVVEGILVRGETDFDIRGTCFVSNQVPNDGGSGESVSKSLTFAEFVPAQGGGTVSFDKTHYQCADTISVTVTDTDLAGTGLVTVSLTGSGGDAETLNLGENAHEGTFSGTIALRNAAPTTGNGMVEAAEGETLTVTYRDASGNDGEPATVTATARVDCTAPVITNVSLPTIGGTTATVMVTTNEPTTVRLQLGTSCGRDDIVTLDSLAETHNIHVTGLTPQAGYFLTVEARDAAGNLTLDNNGGACYTLNTVDQADYFTETFPDETSDLEGMSVTFVPTESASGYSACVTSATAFPADPACGTAYSIGDDAFVSVGIEDGKTFTFYGISYDSFFVGSNGYITFGSGDTSYEGLEEAHFTLPRISGFFTDLVPGGNAPVIVQQWDDRVSVTYEDIPDWWGDIQRFQIELFFDGAIRITWIQLTNPFGVTGLSAGGGVPTDFEMSDMSAYGTCDTAYLVTECDGAPITPQCNGGSGVPGNSFGSGGDLIALGAMLVMLLAVGRGTFRNRRGLADQGK